MKNKPKPPVKLPKAAVRYWLPSDEKLCRSYSCGPNFGGWTIPCAVLPCRTRREARRIVRLHGMSHEDLRQRISRAIYSTPSKSAAVSTILQSLHLIP